jgi:hypothetical protein
VNTARAFHISAFCILDHKFMVPSVASSSISQAMVRSPVLRVRTFRFCDCYPKCSTLVCFYHPLCSLPLFLPDCTSYRFPFCQPTKRLLSLPCIVHESLPALFGLSLISLVDPLLRPSTLIPIPTTHSSTICTYIYLPFDSHPQILSVNRISSCTYKYDHFFSVEYCACQVWSNKF